MGVKKDYAGVRFDKLVGVKETSLLRNRSVIWEFLCDCGNVVERLPQNLKKNKYSCCGCSKGRAKKTHGMSSSKVYKTWCGMKDRCFNSGNSRYDRYKDLEVKMEPKWVSDFECFYAYIGDPPKSEKDRHWSIDRKDNLKGYVIGNVRWATELQQARNKGILRTSKTGVNGVTERYYKGVLSGYTATWYIDVNKRKSKLFSIKDYGNEGALKMATKVRDEMIRDLNRKNFGYGVNHGK